MSQWFRKYERVIVGALIAMLAVVVALSTDELGWVMLKDIL